MYFNLFYSEYSICTKKGNTGLKLGYGIGTSNQFVSAISDIGAELFLLGTSVDYEDYKSIGAINISYKNVISNKLMLGGSFIFERNTNNIVDDDLLIGERISIFNTITGEIDYRYVSNESFQMYSGLGIGYTFGKQNFDFIDSINSLEHTNHSYLNFQVNLIGLRVGKKIAGFTEIGFGYKGIINLGVSAQF